MTGESLEGVSLTEQWECVDVLARGWRAWSSGRQGKQPAAEGKGKKPMPYWKRKRQVPVHNSSDEGVQYCFDDY